MNDPLRVGVIGVGSMGTHHARAYQELTEVELVGVSDASDEIAESVADDRGTIALDRDTLLRRTDAVSVAVPTAHHAAVATEAIERGVDVLVEKPLANSEATGRDLAARAREEDVTVQVGHVERFNPAVQSLRAVLASESVSPVAVTARRQGPPVDRAGSESVVMDLMIHDIDLLLSLADSAITEITATGAQEAEYVDASVRFENGLVGSLTASRISQQRVRDLTITAPTLQINVDYLDQSIQIYRESSSEYVADDGDVRYRNESVIEQPMVANGEPLKAELSAFVEAVRSRSDPPVTVDDGLRALEVAGRIESEVVPERAAPSSAT